MDPSWNAKIIKLPGAHILQTAEWGKIKALVGWKPVFRTWSDRFSNLTAAAMVLQRTVPTRAFAYRFRIQYVPKGPLISDWNNADLRNQVLQDLEDLARTSQAVFIKIDPDVPLAYGIPGQQEDENLPAGEQIVQHLRSRGWVESQEQIQFRNTVVLDLTPDAETLLSRMKQKTRYNIRLAERKGVTMRFGNKQDLPMLYKMYAETSIRDGFVIRDQSYYLYLWQTFFDAEMMDILIAEVEQQPVAGLLLFHFGETAWYIYGMSRTIHREKMPTYLLQWKAILRAKSLGCSKYDLWGAPDRFTETDSLWGVFRFKEGLGGKVIRHIGAWDLPLKPGWYSLYTKILPRVLDIARQRGFIKTKRTIES